MQVGPRCSVDDDSFADSFDSQTKLKVEVSMEIHNLLSANQLLESVS